MSDLEKHGSYTPRQVRERPLYQYAIGGFGTGVVTVVGLVLAGAGVIGRDSAGFAPFYSLLRLYGAPRHSGLTTLRAGTYPTYERGSDDWAALAIATDAVVILLRL